MSFDVVSLFTNLPFEVVRSILSRKWDGIKNVCTLTWSAFIDILEFIFDSNFLLFNNSYYKQIFGTPMGSKISPILVNFVLDELVQDVLSLIPYDVPFVKRYVDDLILSVPSERVEETLYYFNSYDINLQFTSEVEENHSIPFLDMRVCRDNHNVLRTKWYRKPICSNRFLNFHSYHHKSMKQNLIVALKNRVTGLSHPVHRQECLKELGRILLDNSYPKYMINKFLFNTSTINNNNFNNIIENNVNTLNNQTQSQQRILCKYRSLPYIQELTPKLTNIFKSPEIRIAKKNLKTVNLLYSKTKTPLSKFEQTNVIYQLSCVNCDKIYIGQTGRNLSGRIASHKSDCKLKKPSCALAEHSISTFHNINFNEPTILAIEENYSKRNFLEMVYVSKEPNSMNKRSDIANLSIIYNYILSFHKNNVANSNNFNNSSHNPP